MDEIKREKGFVVVDAESNCMNGQTEFFLSRGEAEEYIGEQVKVHGKATWWAGRNPHRRPCAPNARLILPSLS